MPEYISHEVSEAMDSQPLVKETSTYMTDRDAEKMCKLFADGLDAGIGYDRIFDFMERQGLDKGMVRKLRASVVDYGDQLGEAFTRLGLLDGVSRKVILVAEEQGELVPSFREQGRMFGERYRRRKNIVLSMAESIVLIGLSLVLMSVFSKLKDAMLAYDMWEVLTPAFIKGGLQAAIVSMGITLFLYAWLQAPIDSALRDSFNRLGSKIPLIATPLKQRSIANFTRYLNQSIRAGMDMTRSIELAAEAANSSRFTRYIDPAIQALEGGYSLEQSLSVMKGLPQEVIDYIGIGEETGKLDHNLSFLTDKYDTLADENFDRLVKTFVYVLRLVIMITIFITVVFNGVLELFNNDFDF